MGERRTIPYVNLSALFTSAPDWFMTTIPEEAFGGGLLSRFIVCCLNKRDINHIDIQADDKAADEVTSKLATGLPRISGQFKGHVKGTDDAQEWITSWYLSNEAKVLEDERLSPHRNRKPANLLRLAIILAAAAEEPILSKQRLEEALAIIDWIEPTMHLLYGLASVSTQWSKGEKRVLQLLSKEGGEMVHTDLANRACSYFKGYTKELRYALDGMVEKGLVEAVYRNGVRSWPPLGWKLLLNDDGQEMVM